MRPRVRAFYANGEKGAALVTALLVLFVLTSAAIALAFIAGGDVRASRSGNRAKKAFYLAEAGIEEGRESLRTTNIASTDPDNFIDELEWAAGPNGDIDFDAANLKATYDASGNVTGFTGYGDDRPIKGSTTLSDGMYAAFLTNDPLEGRASQHDSNERVSITAIGAGADRSLKLDEAILERLTVPSIPAAITLLGPVAPGGFSGGASTDKRYYGDDCFGATGYSGDSSIHMPTVGTTSAASDTNVEPGVVAGATYVSDGENGVNTVDDVHTTMDPMLADCAALQELARDLRAAADYICTATSPCHHWPTTTTSTITFADGNLDLNSMTGKGILWVTGNLTVRGGTSWEGAIFVMGTGSFSRSGGGNGHTWGAIMVADLAGPDGIYGNTDDCTGGTNGFGAPIFQVSGGGNHSVAYCSDAIAQTGYGLPISVIEFRER